ncbi:MAG: AsmA family protein [Candidatus Zixiibacteriota bacterium]
MKSKKGLKILIGIVAGVIILLVLASVVAKIIFTKQKLLSMLVPKIETALKRKVQIDDVSISIWGGLGVDVKGMRVLNPAGFVRPELFKFDQLSIRVKFMPLLRKRIEVKKLILSNPEISLEKNKDGISNYGDLITSSGGKIVLPLASDQVEIKDGTISYVDDQDGKSVILHKYEETARLSLDEKMENARATGKITVPQIELNLPSYKGTLPPLTFYLEHDINLNMSTDVLEIKALKIGIAKISLTATGKVQNISATPVLDLAIQSTDISLADILASLPKEKSSPLNKLTTSGTLKVSASVQGEAKGEPLPQFKGKIGLQNVKVEFAGVPESFNMSYGEMNFDNRSLSFSSSQAQFGQAPMELKLVVENFSDPSITSELKAKLNLAIVSAFVRLPERTSLAGDAEINVKAYGKIKSSAGTIGPERMNFTGQVQLTKVEATTPALGVPVSNLNADLSFQKGDVDISSLSLSLGSSSLSLQGKLSGAIPYFLFKDQKKPLFSFNLNSPMLNLDEILPASAQGTGGATGKATDKTKGADTIPLPDINVNGQIAIQKAVFRKVEFADLSAKVDVTDGVLRLDNIVTKVYSGSVGGKVTCDLNQIEHIPYNIDLTANQIEANDFLSRFTSFDNHLFGKLNLTATFSGKGNALPDVQKTLAGNGTANFADGKLVNWELLDKAASFFNVPSFKEQQIKTLKNSFRVADSRVWFDDFAAVTKDGDFNLTGSVGLDGSLDYKLTAVLSPELSTRFDALGSFSDYVKNEQGRVVLDIKITGPAKNPEFAWDASRAQGKLKEDLKAKAKEQGNKVQDQLKEKGQDLLNDLLKKKKK